LTGSAWDGQHHDPAAGSKIATAYDYMGTALGAHNTAVAYINDLKTKVDSTDGIVSLPEAQAYLDKVLKKYDNGTFSDVTKYLSQRTATVDANVTQLYKYLSARDNMLDVVNDISEQGMQVQKDRRKLYEEAKAIEEQERKLRAAHPELPASAFFGRQKLETIIESENPQGSLSMAVSDGLLGNGGFVNSQFETPDAKHKVDVYSVGFQLEKGTPLSSRRASASAARSARTPITSLPSATRPGIPTARPMKRQSISRISAWSSLRILIIPTAARAPLMWATWMFP
jgi:hypothetical protein